MYTGECDGGGGESQREHINRRRGTRQLGVEEEFSVFWR
jgi:hypothetical protein